MQKIIAIFKVVGLNSPASFMFYKENDYCWARSGLPKEKYDELFNKAKNEEGFWRRNITAIVECDGIGFHGSPINGVVTSVGIDSVTFY